MLKYVIKRFLQMIVMLFALSVIVFLMVRLIPGDPVTMMLGQGAGAEAIAAERARLGLDYPLPQQYVMWLTNVFQGDFGTSITTHKPVLAEIVRRYPLTIVLAVGSTALSAVVGIAFGIISAVHHGKLTDSILMFVSLIAVSTPSFFLAIVLLIIFSVTLKWFPSGGATSWVGFVLPIITLGMQEVGYITRITRSAMLDVLGEDYIRTSRARGGGARGGVRARAQERHHPRFDLDRSALWLPACGRDACRDGLFARRHRAPDGRCGRWPRLPAHPGMRVGARGDVRHREHGR